MGLQPPVPQYETCRFAIPNVCTVNKVPGLRSCIECKKYVSAFGHKGKEKLVEQFFQKYDKEIREYILKLHGKDEEFELTDEIFIYEKQLIMKEAQQVVDEVFAQFLDYDEKGVNFYTYCGISRPNSKGEPARLYEYIESDAVFHSNPHHGKHLIIALSEILLYFEVLAVKGEGRAINIPGILGRSFSTTTFGRIKNKNDN